MGCHLGPTEGRPSGLMNGFGGARRCSPATCPFHVRLQGAARVGEVLDVVVMTADNGRIFEVEANVSPWDLKAGDDVFYTTSHCGYASILAVGRTETVVGTYGQYLQTPIIGFWGEFRAKEWLVSIGVFSRILKEVTPMSLTEELPEVTV